MPAPDEIIALRRLMESINKAQASTSGSVGKIATEQQNLQQQLAQTRQVADRALQMCNDLAARVKALEQQQQSP